MSDDFLAQLDDDTAARLSRYVTGAASADEALEVERWIAADPPRRALVEQLAGLWRLTGDRPDALRSAEFDLERARLSVKRKIRWGAEDGTAWAGRPRRASRLRAVAAAAAIAVLATGGWWASRGAFGPTPDAPVWVAEHQTGLGELRTVELADGSQVTLAPGSALRQARFGATREVSLTGKAYFDVTHDPAHPFVVRAGAVETRVLGTTFSVTARPGEAADIVLRSGRVAVTAASANKVTRALLEPGQRAIGTADGSIELSEVDVARALAWTTGRLAFAGAPLPEVTREVGHWFGVPIVVADSSLLSRRVTGSFSLDSQTAVIGALAALTDAAIVARGDTIVFERRNRP